MTSVEFRTRSTRLPPDFGGEIRIHIGKAANGTERRELEQQKDTLVKLRKRGQWDVFRQLKAKQRSVEEICRMVDESGIDSLHVLMADPGIAPSLSDAVSAFLETLSGRTRAIYEAGLNHLLKRRPGRLVTDVHQHVIDEVLIEMDGVLATNTIASARISWSAFYTWWIKRDVSRAKAEGRLPFITEHPVRGARRTPTVSNRARFLTRAEFARLLEVATREQRVHYLTLLYTGLRIHEFINLPPAHVRLERRVISVAKTGTWKPKNKRGTRDIPIHRGHLLPELEWYAENIAGEDTFFVNPRTHEKWRYSVFTRWLERDVIAAGMIYGRDHPRGVTPHTFRHTLGSWLAQANVQLLKIAEILGDTVAVIVEYYAHLMETDLDETINEVL